MLLLCATHGLFFWGINRRLHAQSHQAVHSNLLPAPLRPTASLMHGLSNCNSCIFLRYVEFTTSAFSYHNPCVFLVCSWLQVLRPSSHRLTHSRAPVTLPAPNRPCKQRAHLDDTDSPAARQLRCSCRKQQGSRMFGRPSQPWLCLHSHHGRGRPGCSTCCR
jgi:hypothetical protein